jgi:hypothetical protein
MNKLQKQLDDNLEKHREFLLKYLFDDNLKQKFINNQKLKFPSIFKNIFYYPRESHLRGFMKGNKNYKQLFTCLLKIIKGEFRDDWQPPYGPNVYRCINPIFFLLFYPEFKTAGFEYLITQETNTVNIYHKTIHIREQYSESFRIYYELISDPQLEFILNDKLKILYTDVKIEERIIPRSVYCGRYVDMVYCLDDSNKVFIEINEKEHDKDEDYLRMRQIYARSLNKIVQYYTSKNLNSIKKELFKEFSKKFYNIDKKISINLYMVKINNFELKLAKKFTEINTNLKNGGFELKELIKMLKDWDFNNCEKIIKKMIKKKILNSDHLINEFKKSKLLINKKINNEVKLNSYGVTTILQYPRQKNWINRNSITHTYSKFMDCYYTMIEDLLNNSSEELKLIYDEHNSVYDFVQAYRGVFAFGLKMLGNICKEHSSYQHNEILPFLVKDEKSHIDFKDLKNKINNEKLFEHFQKHTESRRVLHGWKYIEESTLNNIIDKYKENISQSNNIESEVDSDCEEI